MMLIAITAVDNRVDAGFDQAEADINDVIAV